jgi:pimeloyl-ACP methyl ester carboxylesterase
MSDSPLTPASQRRIPVGSIKLSLVEYGTAGSPLILLHGIGSRGVSWWPVIDTLAAHFRLIVPDLRGHGDSDKPASGYQFTDYAGDLAALIDELKLTRPLILGHSLGGIVTLAWAIFHPDRAERIALADVALRGGSRAAPLFDDWLALASMTVDDAAAHYRREHPEWTEEECRRRAVSITSTTPAVFTELRDSSIADTGGDGIALLAAIRSPVLLVRGDPETGSMVVPDDAERFAATLPDARLAHIPGGSHSLHRENTNAFLDVVLPFLLGESQEPADPPR